MQVDLSKLSPMGRFKMLNLIQEEAVSQSTNISADLPEFPEGSEARKELEEWRDGARELSKECTRLRKEDA